MGSLLKVWVTRYKDAKGRQVPKATPGAKVVKERSAKWYGQYTDATGVRRRVPLCGDKAAARAMLAALEREADRGRAGLVDPYAEHRRAPIAEALADYEGYLGTKGLTADYLKETLRELSHVLAHSEARSIGEIRPEAVDRFLGMLAARGTGPVSRNHYLIAAKSFTRWCLLTRRLGEDPLACLRPASKAVRRRRRALTTDELVRLVAAARERPLLAALTIKRGPRMGMPEAAVHPDTRAMLERLGLEHALIYKTLVHTGLRRGELASVEVRNLTLDGDRPCVTLHGEDTKNGQDASVPLRDDLAKDLADWVAATGKGPTDRVFRIGEEFLRVLKRDLAHAGIPFKDEMGRQVDVHALRHTTASHMGKGRVNPRVAQAFMRHSDVNMTMSTYTDARLLDEREALDALPTLPVEPEAKREPRRDKDVG